DGLIGGEQLQIGYAIDCCPPTNGCEVVGLACIGCHDEFSAVLERYYALATICIERVLTRHTEARHQAARGIVDSGVNDFAVARGCLRAYCVRGLRDNDFSAGKREDSGDCQAYHTSADHYAVD